MSNASNNGKPLSIDDMKNLVNGLVDSYAHTLSTYVFDENGNPISFKNKDATGYGYTGEKDADSISLEEQLGLDIATGKFASWIFYNNGKVDMSRLSSWLTQVGYDGSLTKNGLSLETAIQTYIRGPADSVESLGAGSKYISPEIYFDKNNFSVLHRVQDAEGDEKLYTVITVATDDHSYGEEARGTEAWFELTKDSDGMITGSKYAGTVKTGQQLADIRIEEQNQRNSNGNKSRYPWAVTDYEYDKATDALKEIHTIAAQQASAEQRAVRRRCSRRQLSKL